MLIKPPRQAHAGFSMIEVLITIVVISIALLGVAKMQAASISNTQDARVRSLVAMQTSSLASAMHANGTHANGAAGYWASNAAPTTCTITGTTVCTALSGGAVTDCIATACASALASAKADMAVWAASMNSAVPGYSALVTCAPTATPVTCSIKVTWNTKYVAINNQQSDNAAATNSTANTQSNFTLLVAP